MIGVADIETIVVKIARIPPKSVSADDKKSLQKLEDNLKMVVFGQDNAITTLSTNQNRAGLKPVEKPIGSFISGPNRCWQN